MDATVRAFQRLTRFVRAMAPSAPAIDAALPASRALLAAAGARFKYVGGVAVVHHGYVRTTDRIDVLVDAPSVAKICDLAPAHGFVVEWPARLRHVASQVTIDLLVAGAPMPRAVPSTPTYPDPDDLAGSENDPTIVGLSPLCELKLRAHRHRDLADIVELLGPLDDGHYLLVEAGVARELRPELAALRDDALEERAQGR
jgi:hypothetical protein